MLQLTIESLVFFTCLAEGGSLGHWVYGSMWGCAAAAVLFAYFDWIERRSLRGHWHELSEAAQLAERTAISGLDIEQDGIFFSGEAAEVRCTLPYRVSAAEFEQDGITQVCRSLGGIWFLFRFRLTAEGDVYGREVQQIGQSEAQWWLNSAEGESARQTRADGERIALHPASRVA